MTAHQNSKNKPQPQTLLQGLLPFDKSRIGPDILAGLTLAALGIPEVMGYTKIIGTPVITGLYTLFLPVLVFALFGSSRHLVVSADSATAAMVAAALATLSFTAYTPRYVELTSLIAPSSSAFCRESAFRLPGVSFTKCWELKRVATVSSVNCYSLFSIWETLVWRVY